MRISDWSSDVCSSDLTVPRPGQLQIDDVVRLLREARPDIAEAIVTRRLALESARTGDIRSSAHVVHEPVHAVADIGLERGYNEARGGKSKRRRAQLSNHGRLPSRSGERCGPAVHRPTGRRIRSGSRAPLRCPTDRKSPRLN